MRRWRRALVVVATLAMTIAGTGYDAMPAGKPLVVGLVAEPTSMDPGQLTDINSMRVLSSVYDTLVRFKEGSFTQEPGLATSWKMSPDGLTYTFTLRKGVKFHDGTPFDAEAVKFTYDRLLDPKHPYAETGPFPFASFYYGAIKEVTVVDPATVRFTAKQPFSPLLNNLTLNTGRIVSPAAVKKYGKEFASHPVGTGPFKFVSWDKNVRIVLEANAAYWGGPPKLSGIVFRPLVEEQTRVTELMSGGVDFIVDVPPDNVAQVKKDARLVYYEQPGPHIWWVTLNTEKKPFNDVKVRRAVNHAVNRDAIVKELFQNNAQVIPGHVSPLQNGYANLSGYAYDPKKAKELLAQAGKPSLRVKLWSPKGRFVKDYELAQAVQQDLAAVGVEAALSTFEWGAYLSATKTPADQTDRELFLLGWSPSTGEARWGTFPLLHSSQFAPKGDNRGFFASKALDEAIDKATLATTDPARLGALREAQQIAINEAPYIFLISPNMVVGTSKKVREVVNLPLELTYLTEKSWKDK